jgi:hypothetical protein
VGLIVSELITNAERHAFRNAGGCIRVELLPSQSFAECRVTDDGTNQGDICPGHGLAIVEALVRSLGGTLDQHLGPQGTTSVLSFPYILRRIDWCSSGRNRDLVRLVEPGSSRCGIHGPTRFNRPLSATARSQHAEVNRREARRTTPGATQIRAAQLRRGAVIELTVNNVRHKTDVEAGTPLLWYLRDEVGLTGTRFGCGAGMCGCWHRSRRGPRCPLLQHRDRRSEPPRASAGLDRASGSSVWVLSVNPRASAARAST